MLIFERNTRHNGRLLHKWVHTSPDTKWRGSLVDPELLEPAADRLHDADHYRQVMDALWDIPQCVGYHLCGAYIKNNARKYGFRDHKNNQINETVAGIRAVNTEMQRRQNR